MAVIEGMDLKQIGCPYRVIFPVVEEVAAQPDWSFERGEVILKLACLRIRSRSRSFDEWLNVRLDPFGPNYKIATMIRVSQLRELAKVARNLAAEAADDRTRTALLIEAATLEAKARRLEVESGIREPLMKSAFPSSQKQA